VVWIFSHRNFLKELWCARILDEGWHLYSTLRVVRRTLLSSQIARLSQQLVIHTKTVQDIEMWFALHTALMSENFSSQILYRQFRSVKKCVE